MTNPANGSGERSPAFDSSSSESAKLLWAPADRDKEGSRITAYTRWLAETSDLHFPDYESLWQWSTTNIEAFWASAWHFFDIRARTPYRQVLSEHVMPGARWFDGAELNFVDQIFRHVESAEASGRPAIVYAGTRKSCESLADRLGAELGIEVLAYHAGLGRNERTAAQRRFRSR